MRSEIFKKKLITILRKRKFKSN